MAISGRFDRRLTALTDLDYRCYEQQPPLLLDALHNDKPQCRLQYHSFWLNSLNDRETNSKEFEAMKSPSLHLLMLRLPQGREQGSTEWSQEEALLRVLGLAPNAERARVRFSQNPSPCPETTQPRWEGFTQEDRNVPLSLGSLTSLTFSQAWTDRLPNGPNIPISLSCSIPSLDRRSMIRFSRIGARWVSPFHL